MQAPRQAFQKIPSTRRPKSGFGLLGSSLLVAGLCLFFGVAEPHLARANDVDLGRHKDWAAHSYTEGNAKVCNMWSRPTKHEEQGRPRGDIYAFVTHRPSDKERDEVSLQMGYPVKPGSEVRVRIGNKSFNLFTEGESAFAFEVDDPKLVDAMRKGATMIVEGESQRGTKTKDTYSLSGFTAAYKKISASCTDASS